MFKQYYIIDLDEYVSEKKVAADLQIMITKRKFECTDWGDGTSPFFLNNKLNGELRELYISSQLNCTNKSGNGYFVFKSITVIGKEGL